MAKYFLGSVGRAEAFRRLEGGNLELLFSSKTLTDSGINISTSKDDIRAGEGAPVQFSFFHDPSVEITLTDVLWKREYLEAQLGVVFDNDGGNADYITETLTASGTTLTLNHTLQPMPLPCAGGQYIVWGSKKGADDWKVLAQSDSVFSTITVADSNGEYCVRYLGLDARAKVAEITSTIIPEELFLIITAPIYAGDACAASRGKAAGHITFEVPRFQLNGSQDFTMNMSSNQTMSLSGMAMATTAESCDSSAGKLLRVIEVIENENWYDSVVNLVADDEYLEKEGDVVIYAVTESGNVFKCDPSALGYATTDVTPASGSYTRFTNGKYPNEATVYVNIMDADNHGVLAANQAISLS